MTPHMEVLYEGAETAELDALSAAGEELDLATVLHALSDPIRLSIVAQLADGVEMSCGAFGLPVAKSTCSHHFRVLREAGVVNTRVEGKSRLNTLAREALDERFPGLIDAVLGAQRAQSHSAAPVLSAAPLGASALLPELLGAGAGAARAPKLRAAQP